MQVIASQSMQNVCEKRCTGCLMHPDNFEVIELDKLLSNQLESQKQTTRLFHVMIQAEIESVE